MTNWKIFHINETQSFAERWNLVVYPMVLLDKLSRKENQCLGIVNDCGFFLCRLLL